MWERRGFSTILILLKNICWTFGLRIRSVVRDDPTVPKISMTCANKCGLWQTTVLLCSMRDAGLAMANERKEPSDHYREQRAKMLILLEGATTDDARKTFLELAAHWDNLAQQLEKKKRERPGFNFMTKSLPISV